MDEVYRTLGRVTTHFTKSMEEYMQSVSVTRENGIYDMNELPYISQSRSILVFVCVIMFFTAACVYMPLGNIQADYNGKCFLHTKLHFDTNKWTSNNTEDLVQKLILHTGQTEWGPVFNCNMTTYTPVMVGILSMIIGWSTFTMWPTMMEMGKGGGLMLVYTFLYTVCLGCNIASTVILFTGYEATCKNLDSSSISCLQLNSKVVRFKEYGEFIIVKDIHRGIVVAEVASTVLIGLSCLQIFVSLGTFGIIWYHFNFLALQLYYSDDFSISPKRHRSWTFSSDNRREDS